MGPTTASPNPTLASMLHERALVTPTRRLVFDLAIGALVASYAIWWRPTGWTLLASAGVCFAMYGVWAMAECRLESLPSEMTRPQRFVWRLTSGVTALVGVISAFFLMFAVVGAMLGTWIS